MMRFDNFIWNLVTGLIGSGKLKGYWVVRKSFIDFDDMPVSYLAIVDVDENEIISRSSDGDVEIEDWDRFFGLMRDVIRGLDFKADESNREWLDDYHV